MYSTRLGPLHGLQDVRMPKVSSVSVIPQQRFVLIIVTELVKISVAFPVVLEPVTWAMSSTGQSKK